MPNGTEKDAQGSREVCTHSVTLSFEVSGPITAADVETAFRAVIADGGEIEALMDITRKSLPDRGNYCATRMGEWLVVGEEV